MDILSQTKLSRSEWESIEKPVSESEMQVLKMINNGYENINIISNLSNSMITFTKLQVTDEIHTYLFNKYFEPIIQESYDAIYKKTISALSNDNSLRMEWEACNKSKNNKKKQKKIKSGDSIRIEQLDKKISTDRLKIYEFDCMDLCVIVLKNALKSLPYDDALYTLIEWRKATIYQVNPIVLQYVDAIIHFGKENVKRETMIENAYKNIEKNEKLYKYEDKQLFSHQKELFALCKHRHNEYGFIQPTSKLILYTAPYRYRKNIIPYRTIKWL